MANNFGEKVSFIWSVADLLRGPYKPAQYGKVILPLTVLRRLDCVLEPTKAKVLAKAKGLKGGKGGNIEPILNRVAKVPFHNTSKLDFGKLKGEPDKIAANLTRYIKSFSKKAREIIDYFGFETEIAKLDESDRLFLVVSKFCDIDLHPDVVLNTEMGYIFEELIRKFNEAANETAGDHFTPREVIRLMVNLLFEPDGDVLTKKGILKTLYDPACGTGGMLAVADEYLHELNPDASLEVFGQDWNRESYAVCGSDMLIKGHDIDHIAFGSSFSKDAFPGETFDYMLANPPFGVEWKPDEHEIRKEADTRGLDGRFGAGLHYPCEGDGVSDTRRDFCLLDELGTAYKLIVAGLGDLQEIDMGNDFYHLPHQSLASGLERLMKCYICLVEEARNGSYPNIQKMKTIGHDLVRLSESIGQSYFANHDIPVLNDDSSFLKDDELLKSILHILSEFGKFARYYNLDVVTGNEKLPINPKEEWEALESKIEDMTPYLGEESTAALTQDYYPRVHGKIIAKLERFIRAIARQFTLGRHGDKLQQYSCQLTSFRNLADEELGTTDYQRSVKILQKDQKNWVKRTEEELQRTPWPTKTLTQADFSGEWPFRAERVVIECRDSLFCFVNIRG